MPKINYPDIELVRQSLRYEDGKLFWLPRPPEHFKDPSYSERINKTRAGEEAGCISKYIDKNGKLHKRWVIRVFDIKLYRYQIIWALHKNEWLEKNEIDHENRNTLDDKIENLRSATRHNQAGNVGKRSHNTSGYKGVTYVAKRDQYFAQMTTKDGHKGSRGFDTPEEAHEEYCRMAREYFGEFFHDGKDPE
jgi:hypothetical protein